MDGEMQLRSHCPIHACMELMLNEEERTYTIWARSLIRTKRGYDDNYFFFTSRNAEILLVADILYYQAHS